MGRFKERPSGRFACCLSVYELSIEGILKGIHTGNDNAWLCPIKPVVRRHSLQGGDEGSGLEVLGLMVESVID